VASRMAGTERSRGFCLELICADFQAGRAEESSPDEIVVVIEQLVNLLPPGHLQQLAGQIRSPGAEAEP
jgi:hypothetical protein